ncbi:hypothetical protein V8C26DRAFT_390212, partial [Trichoderma gracile]
FTIDATATATATATANANSKGCMVAWTLVAPVLWAAMRTLAGAKTARMSPCKPTSCMRGPPPPLLQIAIIHSFAGAASRVRRKCRCLDGKSWGIVSLLGVVTSSLERREKEEEKQRRAEHRRAG